MYEAGLSGAGLAQEEVGVMIVRDQSLVPTEATSSHSSLSEQSVVRAETSHGHLCVRVRLWRMHNTF